MEEIGDNHSTIRIGGRKRRVKAKITLLGRRGKMQDATKVDRRERDGWYGMVWMYAVCGM